MSRWRTILTAGLAAGVIAATLAACVQTTRPPEGIGNMVYVSGESVAEYRPRPALVTKHTEVTAARFPAVDVHCHWTLAEDPAALLAAMDERNVRTAVNLSGGWGDQLESMLERFHRFAPDRFVIFCNLDFARIDDPDFGPQAVAQLEEAHRGGARGLKIFKSLGLRTRDDAGHLVAIDDRRLDPVWATCGRLGFPVLIHTADPVAFFEPVDRWNERWMQLKRRPTWSFAGPGFPSREELLAQRNLVLARHPQTTFIGAHVANDAEDLERVRATLDQYPNLVLDISGRVGELGRQPYASRRLCIDYADRVLFGTDRYPGREDQPRYRIYFRFLESDDEYFDYYDHAFPPAGDWKIYGLALPDEVLRKIYSGNYDRIMSRITPTGR